MQTDPGNPRAQYWSDVFADWHGDATSKLWRAHSDAVNVALLDRWLPARDSGRVLKTDLFDEAVGEGLVPVLRTEGASLTGVDISARVVDAARARYADLETAIADVRSLPYPDGCFDAIVSNSTLDHFESVAELDSGIAELERVLAPGGTLCITLDNRQNPIVGLRTSQPVSRLLRRAGLVPYHLGVTRGRRGLERVLRENGLRVHETSAVMHAPPRIAAALAARLFGPRLALSSYLRWVLAFERLGRWPSRFVTGHFVAARATKPEAPHSQ